MPSPEEADLLVLHTLRLRGFADVDTVADYTGLELTAVATLLEAAGRRGLAVERTGRISGWTLTPDGRALHEELLAQDLAARGCRAAVQAADEAFLALNEAFKIVCTKWQLRDGLLNDHGDERYDDEVIDELEVIHPRVAAITDAVAAELPRFARYARGFDAALSRLRAGETRAFATPLSSSYHDYWMELHQDLMSTLGRERSAADGD